MDVLSILTSHRMAKRFKLITMTTTDKLTNPNYRWTSCWNVWQILNIETDEWVMSIDEGRIYFRGEMDKYPTSEVYTDLDEAKNVCASIINSTN